MKFGECLENVHSKMPLIHNITNYVTVNDVANVLLACGGSPIMADESKEVEDITSICGGLNINIGTLNRHTIPAMFKAGKKANELGHPVLLDPVGAGASSLRTDTAKQLLEDIHFSVIRGNISEIKTLAAGSGSTRGVNADVANAVTEENLTEAIDFVKNFAKATGSIIAVTGAIDLVSDGEHCYVIRNGKAQMGKITGTGSQLSGLMTAYITANPKHMLEAAAAAVCVMGVAGEIGYAHLQSYEGNATYRGTGSVIRSRTWMQRHWNGRQTMNCTKEELLLYAVTDRSWLHGRTLKEQVKEALDGGVTFLQLREKQIDSELSYRRHRN